MAGDTTTTLAEFHKTFYRDFMQEDVPKASAFSLEIMRRGKKEELGGVSRNATWAIRNATGVGFASLSQGGNYPAAQFMSAINPVVGCADFSASVQWSGHALSMGSSKEKTFLTKKLIKTNLTDLREKVKKFIARMLMWDGTDILCQVLAVSGGAGGYFTIKTGGCPIFFFEAGDLLTFRDTASGGSEQLTGAAGSGRILAVNESLGRIYVTDITGAAADDYVAWSGVYGATVIQGLRLLVDQTGTVNGLNRATAANAALSSHEIDLGAGEIGTSDADRIRDVVWESASLREHGYSLSWVCNAKTRRQLAYSTNGQVRFASVDDQQLGTPKMKVGDTDGTKDVIVDQYLIDGELYVVDLKSIGMMYPEGMAGGYLKENGAGGHIFQANATSGVGHSDSELSYHVWRGNAFIDYGRCHGKMINWTAVVP